MENTKRHNKVNTPPPTSGYHLLHPQQTLENYTKRSTMLWNWRHTWYQHLTSAWWNNDTTVHFSGDMWWGLCYTHLKQLHASQHIAQLTNFSKQKNVIDFIILKKELLIVDIYFIDLLIFDIFVYLEYLHTWPFTHCMENKLVKINCNNKTLIKL